MPPKKDHLSPADLRQKVHDHGIRFEGPTPPTKWPEEYKAYFKVIRVLHFLQYEEYKENTSIPSSRRSHYQKRVRNLRTKVRDLLNDLNPNECSWRVLEGPIFEKFDNPVTWYVLVGRNLQIVILTWKSEKCNNELSELDYEASCFNPRNQNDLEVKRARRKMCTCKHSRVHKQTEDE